MTNDFERLIGIGTDRTPRTKRPRNHGLTVAVCAGAALVGLTGAGLMARADDPGASADTCQVTSVHDGDTFRCGREKIRIANIDAPELAGSPKCVDRRRSDAWCDNAAGIAARDSLRAFLARGPVTVRRTGFDRYGRTLATLTVNGQDAGAYLVGTGLARRWR